MASNDSLTELLETVVSNRAIDPAFTTALAAADLWIPVIGDAQAGFSLLSLIAEEQKFVPAFTTRELLVKSNPEASAVQKSYEWLAESLPPDTGVVLNPGQAPSISFSRAEAFSMLPNERVFQVGDVVRLGEPAQEPVELLTAIAEALASSAPEVFEARRVWAQVGERAPGLVVGIGMDLADDAAVKQRAIDTVAAAIGEVGPSFAVDVLFLHNRDPFTDWMMENAEPFYNQRSA